MTKPKTQINSKSQSSKNKKTISVSSWQRIKNYIVPKLPKTRKRLIINIVLVVLLLTGLVVLTRDIARHRALWNSMESLRQDLNAAGFDIHYDRSCGGRSGKAALAWSCRLGGYKTYPNLESNVATDRAESFFTAILASTDFEAIKPVSQIVSPNDLPRTEGPLGSVQFRHKTYGNSCGASVSRWKWGARIETSYSLSCNDTLWWEKITQHRFMAPPAYQ